MFKKLLKLVSQFVQELQRNTRKDPMSKDLDDFDSMDMNSVSDAPVETPKPPEPVSLSFDLRPTEPVGPLSEEDEWARCLSSLKEKCDSTGIAMMNEDGTLYISDIRSCSTKKFMEWVYYMYGPAREFLVEEKEVDSVDQREKIWQNVLNIRKAMVIKNKKS